MRNATRIGTAKPLYTVARRQPLYHSLICRVSGSMTHRSDSISATANVWIVDMISFCLAASKLARSRPESSDRDASRDCLRRRVEPLAESLDDRREARLTSCGPLCGAACPSDDGLRLRPREEKAPASCPLRLAERLLGPGLGGAAP